MATQKISIKYGTYTIAARIGKFRETHAYRTYSLDVDFLLTAANDADFVTALQAAETALEKDNQAIEIKFGSSTHRSLDPSNYSALNVRTTLTKSGSKIDSDRLRQYSWHVECNLPADDLTNDVYRREATWEIDFSESRRVSISFSGTYTAGGGNTAKTNYDAQVGTWITAVFTALSLTEANYELLTEKISAQDDENAILSFTRSYREVLFNEAAATLNTAAIQNAQVRFERVSDNKHGLNQVGAFRANISYSCSVDNDDGTYGTAASLKTLWVNIIKPHLLTQATTIWGGGMSAVENESVSTDVSEHAISANMSVLLSGGNGILSYSEIVDITHDLRRNVRDVWDGEPFTYIFWSPGSKITARQTVQVEKIGGPLRQPQTVRLLGSSLLLIAQPGGGSWQLLSDTANNGSEYVGNDQDGKGVAKEVYKTTYVREFIFAAKWTPAGGPESGGGRARTVLRSKSPGLGEFGIS